MTRIAPPSRPAWWIRALLALLRRRYRRSLRPFELAAHAPGLVIPFVMTGRFAHGRGELSADIRLLAMLLVAELNHCDWCIDFGRSLAGGRLTDKAMHVREFATYPAFSDAERAALRYALEAAGTPVHVSDATFTALRAHFSEPQIVELTFAIAAESFYTRINAPLGVEAEGFCAIAPPQTRAA